MSGTDVSAPSATAAAERGCAAAQLRFCKGARVMHIIAPNYLPATERVFIARDMDTVQEVPARVFIRAFYQLDVTR